MDYSTVFFIYYLDLIYVTRIGLPVYVVDSNVRRQFLRQYWQLWLFPIKLTYDPYYRHAARKFVFDFKTLFLFLGVLACCLSKHRIFSIFISMKMYYKIQWLITIRTRFSCQVCSVKAESILRYWTMSQQ